MNLNELNIGELFNRFCEIGKETEDIRELVEKKVSTYIKQEWNPKLEFYVDCEDTEVISIMVCGAINRVSFEQFIINPLCEKHNLEISYVEICEKDDPYIEWGLNRK